MSEPQTRQQNIRLPIGLGVWFHSRDFHREFERGRVAYVTGPGAQPNLFNLTIFTDGLDVAEGHAPVIVRRNVPLLSDYPKNWPMEDFGVVAFMASSAMNTDPQYTPHGGRPPITLAGNVTMVEGFAPRPVAPHLQRMPEMEATGDPDDFNFTDVEVTVDPKKLTDPAKPVKPKKGKKPSKVHSVKKTAKEKGLPAIRIPPDQKGRDVRARSSADHKKRETEAAPVPAHPSPAPVAVKVEPLPPKFPKGQEPRLPPAKVQALPNTASEPRKVPRDLTAENGAVPPPAGVDPMMHRLTLHPAFDRASERFPRDPEVQGMFIRFINKKKLVACEITHEPSGPSTGMMLLIPNRTGKARHTLVVGVRTSATAARLIQAATAIAVAAEGCDSYTEVSKAAQDAWDDLPPLEGD